MCYGYSNSLIYYCFDYALKENVQHCEVVTVVNGCSEDNRVMGWLRAGSHEMTN